MIGNIDQNMSFWPALAATRQRGFGAGIRWVTTVRDGMSRKCDGSRSKTIQLASG